MPDGHGPAPAACLSGGEAGCRLAHVVQKRGLQEALVAVAGAAQCLIDVQTVALVTACHPAKEGRLRRREALLDLLHLFRADAGKRRPKELRYAP